MFFDCGILSCYVLHGAMAASWPLVQAFVPKSKLVWRQLALIEIQTHGQGFMMLAPSACVRLRVKAEAALPQDQDWVLLVWF